MNIRNRIGHDIKYLIIFIYIINNYLNNKKGAANTIKFGIISMHISKMNYGTINHMANLTISDISSIFQIPLLGEEETKENMPGVTVSTKHCLREFAEKLQYVFHKTALDLKKGGYKSLAQFIMYLINSTKNEVNRAEVILKGIINVLTVFQDSAIVNGKGYYYFIITTNININIIILLLLLILILIL